MTASIRITQADLRAYSKNWGWFFAWGSLLLILGIAAISASTFTTLLSVVFLGYILLFSGALVIIDTITFWWHKWRGFCLHLLMGILYFAVGLFLIQNPVVITLSITLLLGLFYVVLGLARLASSTSLRSPRWGWNFFSGVVSLLLGIMILASWPASSLFIIGLFVGIDLIFSGWAYMMASLAARPHA